MIALMLAVAAAAPVPAEIKIFKDWVAGCDNGRMCQADGVMPRDNYEFATVAIKRGPEANAIPELWFTIPDGAAADLRVDGKPLGVHLALKGPDFGDAWGVASGDVPRVIAALASAKAVAIVDRAGKTIAPISPAGASAALLYIDEQQHRLGTVTALVRKGAAPASAVPAPPPLPAIAGAAGSSQPPRKLDAAAIRKVRGEDSCDDPAEEHEVEYDRLDASTTLAMIPEACVSGAYNSVYVPLLVGNDGSTRDPDFDDSALNGDETGGDGSYNAWWEPRTRRLTSGFKGRGIGDCGVWMNYAWDGRRFRLAEYKSMPDCRGSIDFITTWRARVAGPR